MAGLEKNFKATYSYLEGVEFLGDEPDSATKISFDIPEAVARRLFDDLKDWLGEDYEKPPVYWWDT